MKLPLALACLAFAVTAQAVSFGELKTYSNLGEPLYAEIELRDSKDLDPNTLSANLADAKDFVRAGIERPYILTDFAFQTIADKDKLYITITSAKAIANQYLEFLVELSWSDGNLIKEYAILLGPPPIDAAQNYRPKRSTNALMPELLPEIIDNIPAEHTTSKQLENLLPAVVPEILETEKIIQQKSSKNSIATKKLVAQPPALTAPELQQAAANAANQTPFKFNFKYLELTLGLCISLFSILFLIKRARVHQALTKPRLSPQLANSDPEIPQPNQPPAAEPTPPTNPQPAALFDTLIIDTSDTTGRKISLAKQYLETGDQNSARDLLYEVMEIANDEQKLIVQMLLRSIGRSIGPIAVA